MVQKPRIDIVLVGAVAFEIETLVATLPAPQVSSLLGERCWMARFGSLSLLVGTTGIGKVNGAITTSAILERFRVRTIWNIGCAGAYEAGPLRVGDVLVSDSVLCGDEGVLGTRGVESPRCIGIPLVSHKGKAYYDFFPLGDSRFFETAAALTPPGRYGLGESGLLTMPEATSWEGDCFGSLAQCGSFQIHHGASLTVGMASGDPTTARKRFERYRALAENMEGSAVAQTCLRYGVPMLECRGMSNFAGDRDKSHWRLREAMVSCHAVVRSWLVRLSQDGRWPT